MSNTTTRTKNATIIETSFPTLGLTLTLCFTTTMGFVVRTSITEDKVALEVHGFGFSIKNAGTAEHTFEEMSAQLTQAEKEERDLEEASL